MRTSLLSRNASKICIQQHCAKLLCAGILRPAASTAISISCVAQPGAERTGTSYHRRMFPGIRQSLATSRWFPVVGRTAIGCPNQEGLSKRAFAKRRVLSWRCVFYFRETTIPGHAPQLFAPQRGTVSKGSQNSGQDHDPRLDALVGPTMPFARLSIKSSANRSQTFGSLALPSLGCSLRICIFSGFSRVLAANASESLFFRPTRALSFAWVRSGVHVGRCICLTKHLHCSASRTRQFTALDALPGHLSRW